MNRRAESPRSGLRSRWPLLAVAALVIAALAWFIGGAEGGLLRGRAGFADVSGTWRLDAEAYEAMVAARAAKLAERPGGAVDARLTAERLRAIAAPYAGRRYTFLDTAYLVGEAGGGSRETPCAYVGESPLLLRVVGERPGAEDDLAIILDPSLGIIHLRLDGVVLPLRRE